ncbi:hypothetical protein [Qipengyuania marisflavi]|uniref:Uncharacterized protein n=1 Tax=Qipengyuania marisflavi TaxID=2486356 RepID=A0A5S3P0X2_9SPHN|nr:hypothetical protein [Qipengyuania marisflavi]TMM46216.1 hypothetical protein FEV51_11455 [Qipengyuania marisflavi]
MTFRQSLTAGILAGCAALAAPLAAQTADAPDPAQADDRLLDDARKAERIGAQLYAFDQAAWHGSDAFAKDVSAIPQGVVPLGYVVVPSDQDALDLVFYGVQDEQPVQVARYVIDGGEVTSGGIAIAPLGTLEERLMAARNTAIKTAENEQFQFCADAMPNTVVLPPDEFDEVSVYLLTPMIEHGSFPLSGHYRVLTLNGGAIRGWERFGSACEAISWDPEDDELDLRVFYTSEAKSRHPSEIHSFVGHYVPFSLGVVTGKVVWPVLGGAFADPVEADPEMMATE